MTLSFVCFEALSTIFSVPKLDFKKWPIMIHIVLYYCLKSTNHKKHFKMSNLEKCQFGKCILSDMVKLIITRPDFFKDLG